MKFSKKIAAMVGLIALIGVVLFTHYRSRSDSFRGPEFALRKLESAELASFASKAMKGDCRSAYKVARHHLYYSLDHKQALIFFRIAATCRNANAFAHLADLLTDDPTADGEVDALLTSLEELDPVSADDTRIHISMRRAARKGSTVSGHR
jgi:hypothetical protein